MWWHKICNIYICNFGALLFIRPPLMPVCHFMFLTFLEFVVCDIVKLRAKQTWNTIHLIILKGLTAPGQTSYEGNIWWMDSVSGGSCPEKMSPKCFQLFSLVFRLGFSLWGPINSVFKHPNWRLKIILKPLKLFRCYLFRFKSHDK